MRVVPELDVNTRCELFNSLDQHAARVVLLAGFNTQSVLFQNLMSTHGVSCLNSPDQHAARVVLLAGFSPQCVLFQILMSTLLTSRSGTTRSVC